jgi:hypothetical protein
MPDDEPTLTWANADPAAVAPAANMKARRACQRGAFESGNSAAMSADGVLSEHKKHMLQMIAS